MVKVLFHSEVEEILLKYVVIIARHKNSWMFCKHRKRETLECPGGKIEKGETGLIAAGRELEEETGATDYKLTPICGYSVQETREGYVEIEETFGMLYYADVKSFTTRLEMEIEKVLLLKETPNKWTYPEIQPKLFEKAKEIVDL